MNNIFKILTIALSLGLFSCGSDYSFDVDHEVSNGKYFVYVYASEGLKNSAWNQQETAVIDGELLDWPQTIAIIHDQNPDTLVFEYNTGVIEGTLKDNSGHIYHYYSDNN